jgi:phosphoribosylanthranilate isomerase
MNRINASPQVKICGLQTEATVHAAVHAGAHFIGLNFVPASPRYINIETAVGLAHMIPEDVQLVGLFADPSDEDLKRVLMENILNIVQLHGNESPDRVHEVKNLIGLPVIKAIPIATSHDLQNIPAYEECADWLLFDAKPTISSSSRKEKNHPCNVLTGGTGKAFDWSILNARVFNKPWMLAGGLTAENVQDALRLLSPDAVDVSSGVEHEKGVKDPQKIKAFVKAVQK